MPLALLLTLIIFFSATTANADTPDARVLHLASKILEKIPDARYTRLALGTTEERQVRATEHATAIVTAADLYTKEWDEFARQGNWHNFNAQRDLPALIAAVAMQESAFRSVIRLDGNKLTTKVRGSAKADVGVLQVRAPSPMAKNCGVVGKKDVQRLVDDVMFAYQVGTCVLTRRVGLYVMKYEASGYHRFRRYERADADGLFYGFVGPRKGTEESKLARDLVVIERYNWGTQDLYLHPLHGGYARRVIREFEFFRMAPAQDST